MIGLIKDCQYHEEICRSSRITILSSVGANKATLASLQQMGNVSLKQSLNPSSSRHTEDTNLNLQDTRPNHPFLNVSHLGENYLRHPLSVMLPGTALLA